MKKEGMVYRIMTGTEMRWHDTGVVVAVGLVLFFLFIKLVNNSLVADAAVPRYALVQVNLATGLSSISPTYYDATTCEQLQVQAAWRAGFDIPVRSSYLCAQVPK